MSIIKWIAACACLALALPTFAATHVGVVAQFPENQGDNGFYARALNGGTWLSIPQAGPYDFETPPPDNYWGLPYVKKVNPGYVSLHPGTDDSAGRWAVLSYLAPAAGDYEYDVLFQDANGDQGCSVQALVFVNDNWAGPLDQGWVDLNTTQTFARTVTLAQGDYLNFAVNPTDQGLWDAVRLRDIGSVPEPASMTAMIGGLAGLIGAIRRKKA